MPGRRGGGQKVSHEEPLSRVGARLVGRIVCRVDT